MESSLIKIEKKKKKWKKCFLYLFISFCAYCSEAYRKTRKILRLQSAQKSCNNWIFCINKSLKAPCHHPPYSPIKKFNSYPWVSPLLLDSKKKKKQPPRSLFKFQLPTESQGAAFYAWYAQIKGSGQERHKKEIAIQIL